MIYLALLISWKHLFLARKSPHAAISRHYYRDCRPHTPQPSLACSLVCDAPKLVPPFCTILSVFNHPRAPLTFVHVLFTFYPKSFTV